MAEETQEDEEEESEEDEQDENQHDTKTSLSGLIMGYHRKP